MNANLIHAIDAQLVKVCIARAVDAMDQQELEVFCFQNGIDLEQVCMSGKVSDWPEIHVMAEVSDDSLAIQHQELPEAITNRNKALGI